MKNIKSREEYILENNSNIIRYSKEEILSMGQNSYCTTAQWSENGSTEQITILPENIKSHVENEVLSFYDKVETELGEEKAINAGSYITQNLNDLFYYYFLVRNGHGVSYTESTNPTLSDEDKEVINNIMRNSGSDNITEDEFREEDTTEED